MIKKASFCNNCGRSGHLFHQCKHPIISNGIIVFRIFNRQIEILLVKRKDSLCYVDFITNHLRDGPWQGIRHIVRYNNAAGIHQFALDLVCHGSHFSPRVGSFIFGISIVSDAIPRNITFIGPLFFCT